MRTIIWHLAVIAGAVAIATEIDHWGAWVLVALVAAHELDDWADAREGK